MSVQKKVLDEEGLAHLIALIKGADESLKTELVEQIEEAIGGIGPGVTADGTTIVDNDGTLSIKDGGVGTAQLADASVTADKIADGAVKADAIDTSSITPASIGAVPATPEPQVTVNLASEAAAGVFGATPQPGVTGVLPVSHGGTGASNIDGARTSIVNSATPNQLLAYLRIDEEASETKATGDQPVTAAGLAAVLNIDPDGSGDVDVPPVYVAPGKDIDSYTWEELSIMASDSRNNGKLDYLLGQVRAVTLSGYGSVGFQLIGINHDDLSDESGKAPLTFMAQNIVENQTMGGSVSSGWASTTLHTYLNGTFYNAFPDNVKTLIKQVKKTYNMSSGQLVVDDYLWLASEMEVFGTSTYDTSGTRYAYWAQHTSNSDRIKKLGNEADTWWLRSASLSNGYFAYVNSSGSLDSYFPSHDYGVVPCFCI